MPTTLRTLNDLVALVGQPVAISDWLTVTQEQINLFAQATGDHQWIHVDVERAQAGPFGAPIAHGFLTLSLIPKLFESALVIEEPARMGVNYGLNRVRFVGIVPAGSRLRAHLSLVAADPIPDNGLQMTWDVTIEREGSNKPVCVAQTVSRRYA